MDSRKYVGPWTLIILLETYVALAVLTVARLPKSFSGLQILVDQALTIYSLGGFFYAHFSKLATTTVCMYVYMLYLLFYQFKIPL